MNFSSRQTVPLSEDNELDVSAAAQNLYVYSAGITVRSLQLDSVRTDEEFNLGCWGLCKTNEESVDSWNRVEGVDEVTVQENGQLELVVEHHGVNAAGSTEPRCDLAQEVGVEDEEDDA